jgi:hypothetical protein
MGRLNSEKLEAYQNKTFRLKQADRLKNIEAAVGYVRERNFIFFWPITGISLPSLWAAVAGDRPVADEHDDPGHVSWGWKDAMLDQRRWYYAKVLRKRATIIDLDFAPYFYALSENYGSFEDDYLTLYEQGRMTQEAKRVYDALLDAGPLDTVALRRVTHLTSRESDYRFNRALTELQTDFKILPTGIARAGGWNYAFIYDIVGRYYPELPEQARFVSETEARSKLAEAYFRSVGAAQIQDLAKLFGWKYKVAEKIVSQLLLSGLLQTGLETENKPGTWLALTELVE